LLTSHIPMVSFKLNGIENRTISRSRKTARARARLNPKIRHVSDALSDRRKKKEEKKKKKERHEEDRGHIRLSSFVELVDRETERISCALRFPIIKSHRSGLRTQTIRNSVYSALYRKPRVGEIEREKERCEAELRSNNFIQ